jgi:hypothetical protein
MSTNEEQVAKPRIPMGPRLRSRAFILAALVIGLVVWQLLHRPVTPQRPATWPPGSSSPQPTPP